MPPSDGVTLPPALQADHPLRGLGYSEPVRRRTFLRLDGSQAEPGEAPVAEEVPVALIYNMRPYAVMMATPTDLEDFAVGFSITEAIVATAADIDRVAVMRHAQGIEVQLTIPDAAARRLEERGRSLIGRAGCGLCGVETIQEAMREPAALPPGPPVSADALWRAERELVPRQIWNAETGSLHAAGWFDLDGSPVVVREDVGRHNALDKVIGALAREGHDPANGFVVVTSRASYELVQKAATAGVRVLAAVSRPTGLAIRLAEACGLTLVALLRGTTANVYTRPERLGLG